MHNTININIELNFNLGYTTGSRRNAGQLETAQGLVIARHFSFTLEHMDIYRSLVVSSGRKDLRFSSRDSGIAFNNPGKYPAQGFNTQRESGVTSSKNISFTSPLEYTPLDSRTQSDHFIRVDAFVRFFAA